ncbi:MAG: twin-arginine translocase TatA/TatE family subunit [Actinomycetota bacterium]
MGNLGSGELLVIFFVALIVLGPNKLPDAARQVGRAVNEIRRISGGFQREMREAMQEPVKAAEQAKADMLDPFNQAASSAAKTIRNPMGDTDPPLPFAAGGSAAETNGTDAAAPSPNADATPPADDASDTASSIGDTASAGETAAPDDEASAS